MTLIPLLVVLMWILIIGVIIWGTMQLLPLVPLPPAFRVLAIVVVAIICIVIAFTYIIFPLVHALPPA